MDVAGGGIDMSVTEKGLHHREIDAGLGKDCPKRVTQRVRVPAGHAGQAPVVAEHRPQPRRRQRAAAVRAFADEEQRLGV